MCGSLTGDGHGVNRGTWGLDNVKHLEELTPGHRSCVCWPSGKLKAIGEVDFGVEFMVQAVRYVLAKVL